MTATDELRRMLDECGVEYRAIGDATFWETHGGAFRYKAKPHAEKLTVMTCCSQKCTVMTPAQAIAATVGRGTCYDIEQDENDFKCSACGARSFIITDDCYTTILADEKTVLRRFNYCPNCGAKVVDE